MNVWMVAGFLIVLNIVFYFRYHKKPLAVWKISEKILFGSFTFAMATDIIITYISTILGDLVEVNPIFGADVPSFSSLFAPKVLGVLTVFHMLIYDGTSEKTRKSLLIASNILMGLIVIVNIAGLFISCQYGYLYE